MDLAGMLLALLGGVSLTMSLFQWESYASSRHGRAMIAVFGRKVARVLDIAIGMIVRLLGIAITFEGVL